MVTRLTRMGRICALGTVLLGLGAATAGCVRDKGWPLATVSEVDVSRYAGTWYEIASYPHLFQRGCTNTQATYTPQSDGRVGVKNTCTISKREVNIEGWAEVPDTKYPGQLAVHLKVPIIGETNGEYYIIALDEDYQWAVVGHPNRNYLWILSRKPSLSSKILRKLLPGLETTAEYKDVAKKLRCTPQSEGKTAACEAVLKRASGVDGTVDGVGAETPLDGLD